MKDINLQQSLGSSAGTLNTGEAKFCLQFLSLLCISNQNKQRLKAQALTRVDKDQHAQKQLLSNQVVCSDDDNLSLRREWQLIEGR